VEKSDSAFQFFQPKEGICDFLIVKTNGIEFALQGQ
jgi:hypothetical protein